MNRPPKSRHINWAVPRDSLYSKMPDKTFVSVKKGVAFYLGRSRQDKPNPTVHGYFLHYLVQAEKCYQRSWLCSVLFFMLTLCVFLDLKYRQYLCVIQISTPILTLCLASKPNTYEIVRQGLPKTGSCDQ